MLLRTSVLSDKKRIYRIHPEALRALIVVFSSCLSYYFDLAHKDLETRFLDTQIDLVVFRFLLEGVCFAAGLSIKIEVNYNVFAQNILALRSLLKPHRQRRIVMLYLPSRFAEYGQKRL